MELRDLWERGYLPRELIEEIAKKRKISKLWPAQIKAIERGIFDGRSIIISVPTASGKTFVGELAAAKSALDGKKTLYLVPLKALAEEKFSIFEEDYGKWFTSCIFTKDHSPPENIVKNSKLIVGTHEKIDLLVRNKVRWLKDIQTLVVDEIQMIDDKERGPTLEMVITRLKRDNRDLQIIGLSAVLREESVKQLSKWLKAEYLLDNWRPVELVEGKYSLIDEQLLFLNGTKISLLPEELKVIMQQFGKQKTLALLDHREIKVMVAKELVKMFAERNKQVLVFAMTRKQAEDFVSGLDFHPRDISSTEELSTKVVDAVPEPNKTTKKLEKCVRKSVAFHHAGLKLEHRRIVEKAFEDEVLRVVCATPTLAMGINLPADIVIFLDHARRYPQKSDLKIMEYQNMAGRAGRPGFHDKDPMYKGHSILIAVDKSEERGEIDKYIGSKPEKVYSKMNVAPTLRGIILSLIATVDDIQTFDDVVSFMGDTFFGYTYGDLSEIEPIIKEIVDNLLVPADLVFYEGDILKPTELGKAIAKVGLDPLSVPMIMKGLETFRRASEIPALSILHLVTSTIDFQRLSYLYVPLRLENVYLEEFMYRQDEFLSVGKEDLVSIRGTFILYDWIREVPEGKIIDNHNIDPGDIDRVIELASWILESIKTVADELNFEKSLINTLEKIRKRIKYGIKEELLGFFQVDLASIGRIQARHLYEAGFKTADDVIAAKLVDLYQKGRIRRETARRLKHELVDKIDMENIERKKWKHILITDEIGQNINLIRELYESTDERFSHYLEDAFKTLFGISMRIGRFRQNGNPDIWIKEGSSYFATIECYAPTTRESIDLPKILEAREGFKYSPLHLCVATNAKRIPEEALPDAEANKIVLFHVTGVAELLIQKWKEKLAIDDIKNLFSIEGVVIDDKLVKKLINGN